MNIIDTSAETLKDLVSSVQWCDVCKSLMKYYPDYEEVLPVFEYVFFELQELTPDENGGDKIIIIDEVHNEADNTTWYDVYGYDMDAYDGIIGWAMSFNSWEYWLSLPIDVATLEKFSHEDIVALCLWEMTWDGFIQEEIKVKAKEIFDLSFGNLDNE